GRVARASRRRDRPRGDAGPYRASLHAAGARAGWRRPESGRRAVASELSPVPLQAPEARPPSSRVTFFVTPVPGLVKAFSAIVGTASPMAWIRGTRAQIGGLAGSMQPASPRFTYLGHEHVRDGDMTRQRDRWFTLHDQRGFTLIELLIVVAIIAILAAIA